MWLIPLQIKNKSVVKFYNDKINSNDSLHFIIDLYTMIRINSVGC
jgi:hypothetical protein